MEGSPYRKPARHFSHEVHGYGLTRKTMQRRREMASAKEALEAHAKAKAHAAHAQAFGIDPSFAKFFFRGLAIWAAWFGLVTWLAAASLFVVAWTPATAYGAVSARGMNRVPAFPVKAAAAPTDSCPAQLKDVWFSASFRDGSNKLRVRLGALELAVGAPRTNAPLYAQILDSERCVATCTVRPDPLERDGIFDLTCQGVTLGAMSLRASLVRAGAGKAHGLGGFPMLRLGTWMDGYRAAALQVEYDGFSSRVPALATR